MRIKNLAAALFLGAAIGLWGCSTPNRYDGKSNFRVYLLSNQVYPTGEHGQTQELDPYPWFDRRHAQTLPADIVPVIDAATLTF